MYSYSCLYYTYLSYSVYTIFICSCLFCTQCLSLLVLKIALLIYIYCCNCLLLAIQMDFQNLVAMKKLKSCPFLNNLPNPTYVWYFHLADRGCSLWGCLLTGISGVGSKPDLFPYKQAYVVLDEVMKSFFSRSVDAELYLFHSLISVCAQFKVTHLEDIFMMVGFF